MVAAGRPGLDHHLPRARLFAAHRAGCIVRHKGGVLSMTRQMARSWRPTESGSMRSPPAHRHRPAALRSSEDEIALPGTRAPARALGDPRKSRAPRCSSPPTIRPPSSPAQCITSTAGVIWGSRFTMATIFKASGADLSRRSGAADERRFEYNGYRIRPAPYRRRAVPDVRVVEARRRDQGTRFIRAECTPTREAAIAFSTRPKAKRLIDDRATGYSAKREAAATIRV